MKRLWILMAILAVYGNLAYAYDSDEKNYYDWYDDDDNAYDSPDYAAEETKDDEFENRHTESDKQYDIKDYQVEDNRSEVSDDSLDNSADNTLSSEKNTGKEKQIEYLTSNEVDNLGIDLKGQTNRAADVLRTSIDVSEDTRDVDEKILEDTKAILNEETENDLSEGIAKINITKTTAPIEIIKETSRLLNETSNTMEEEGNDNGGNKFQLQSDEIVPKDIKQTTLGDSVNQTVENLEADLKRLQDTWSELNDFNDNFFDSEEVNTTSLEKNENDNQISNGEHKEEQSDGLIELFPDDSQQWKESNTSHAILYLDDALPATESALTNSDKIENIFKSTTKSILLKDNLGNTQSDEGNKLTNVLESTRAPETDEKDDDVIRHFISENRIAEITQNDVRSANNIWLSIDSPTVITSPGFPDPYPPNAVTDWMIFGDGMGIELNITDFAINGHVGDYVLFKPGGVDESGSTGLLFSYALSNERRYRFLDVDRMFVRFEAKPGPQVQSGFSFSVRMVGPRPGALEPEPEPEPVMPEPPETITLNLGGLTLEGFLQIEEQFRQIVAGMAEMYIKNNDIDPGVNTTLELTQITSRAMCFHNWPKFEKCVEITFGVPLVYEDELVGEDREPRLNNADLMTMWETYSQIDPYAERLRSLGITEYQVPNDRGIMTVWLVIAGGVVISMVMLAFALWRFSCFDNYTRMPAFSDTDSIKEKRNSDLYPTPHQTLPPLYTETDYKWADAKYDDSTKVDVGGYTNKSYMREDLYDLDSDEDIVPVNARNTSSFSPRDIYSV